LVVYQYAYVFSVLAGIIRLSLRIGGGGHLIPFAPFLQVGGGELSHLPPGSPAPPPMLTVSSSMSWQMIKDRRT